jgi:hypothetical protein
MSEDNMSSNITLKRSAISGKIPGTADLGLGELAINTYDGKLFMKKNDGSETIIDITASAGAAYKTGSDDLTTTSINQIVDSFSKVLYRTVKYYVELSTATEYQATELFLTHDGTNVYLTEYATVASGSNLGSITSDISGDSVRLLVTPVSTNTTVKFARIDIDVPFDGSNAGNATAIDNTPIGANIADSGTFTTFSLDSIAETKSVTAVDVFVYDTSKDSDGGAWRKRTQATSWYNEPLNTLTRGSRKEFPAVAVIVAEVSKVTIYDSDDPSLPMWMVFNSNNGTNIARSSVTSISILNGNMTIGHGTSGLTYADFISDAANLISQNRLHNERTIGQRNGGPAWVSTISGGGIVDGTVKDIAMTVLPDAPIDPETGLPIPTIAVATDSGVSVIKDDGTVVDWTPSGDGRVESIYIQDGQIITGNGGGIAYRYSILDQIPQSDTGIASAFEFKQNSVPARSNLDATGPVLPPLNLGNGVYCMTPKFGALNLLQYNKPDPSKGMVNYTASSYTSGWMPGNIKGAFLADTVGVSGAELLGNPSFVNSTNYNLLAGATISGGQLFLTDTPSSRAEGLGNFIPSGIIVQIEIDIASTTGGVAVLLADAGGSLNINGGTFATAGVHRVYINTANTNGNFRIIRSTGASTINSISVTASDALVESELVTNGTFDTDVSGWTINDATRGTAVQSAGRAVITNNYALGSTSGFTAIVQAQATVVGKQYLITANAAGSSGLSVSNNSNGAAAFGQLVGTGDLSLYFIATATTTYLVIYVASGADAATANFDNVSLKLADADRSVANKGLVVNGTITRTPVATGSELVGYSGFSASNYLEQPYNAALNFGTGDFSVMGWFNANWNLTNSVMFQRGKNLTVTNEVGGLLFYVYQDDVKCYVAGQFYQWQGVPLPVSQWCHVALMRKSNELWISINGVEYARYPVTTSVTSTDHVLRIGSGWSGLQGSAALARISATAPSAEQIAKIYRDENVLFQENTACTLYGTSDAVTALSHDPVTDLLHVGTSAGRSVFQGLRRVSNTTVAVGTAISASNGLVVEE